MHAFSRKVRAFVRASPGRRSRVIRVAGGQVGLVNAQGSLVQLASGVDIVLVAHEVCKPDEAAGCMGWSGPSGISRISRARSCNLLCRWALARAMFQM